MKCENCGKEYWTKECLNCKNSYTENDLQRMGIASNKKTLSEKKKLFKVIRYTIIFFIGIFIIGEIAEIYIFNKVIEEVKPYNESMKKSLKTIDKMNEQLYKQIEKMGNR